jgi:hypothetical protein
MGIEWTTCGGTGLEMKRGTEWTPCCDSLSKPDREERQKERLGKGGWD